MHENPIKVLMIEDSLADALLIDIMFRDSGWQNYNLTHYQTFKQGMDKFATEPFDVLLLDLSLPDSFGIETVKNANMLAPNLPIIVLTGHNDDDFALEAVNAGAEDYLVKGQITGPMLTRSIRYAIKRKEQERALKTINRAIEESEKRLNIIVSNNISGIVVIGQEDEIMFANPAAEKILARPINELLGQRIDFKYSLDAPTMVQIARTGLTVEVLAVETIWSGLPSMLITLHDVSELKKAEKSLQTKNDELIRINKALDTFVYIISHDLKKPTTNIQGLLTIFEKALAEDNKEKCMGLLEKLNFSAIQLKQMIEELLESTRKEIDTREQNQLIEFRKIYKEVESTMEQLIESSEANISINFSNYPLIYYPYQDLKSIIGNLLSNAIKYSQPGKKPEISIKTERTSSGPALLISDNGIGMDLNKNGEQLFQKYSRFNDNVEGTGLGLWIIQEIAKKNGGKVEVESQLGEGSTFKVIF